MHRSRPLYLFLTLLVSALGLASRWYRSELPAVLGAYAGDVLWAAMVFLLVALLWHQASRRSLVFATVLFSFAVELSQLYHAPWIDAIRATRIGGLVLGHTFVWSDLVCYLVGISTVALLDAVVLRWTRKHGSAVREAAPMATENGPGLESLKR